MKHQSEESAKNHGEWGRYKAKQKFIEPKRMNERKKKKNKNTLTHPFTQTAAKSNARKWYRWVDMRK